MARRLERATLTLGLAAAAVSAAWFATGLLDGPWGMLPGGRLEGPALPCELAPWEQLGAVREVEVEVRPTRPRSLSTWLVVLEGEPFLPADFLTPWKRWPYQVLEDDRVRLRVDGRIFECRAERVGQPELVARLRLAAGVKYDLPPDGRAARTEVWWFRVGPRSSHESPNGGGGR